MPIAFILLLALVGLLCLGVTFGGLLWIPFAGFAFAALIGLIMGGMGAAPPPKFKDVMKKIEEEEAREKQKEEKRLKEEKTKK
ncbi:hypothetical protein [Paraprevotella xylaniphila]|uniref:hypothetical protein n=1 Tax=Paraprevotella xylaniphila TaxID=454155 RepID=UPI0039F5FE05